MLSTQVVTSEEIPLPYVSLPRLTALVRYRPDILIIVIVMKGN